MNNEDFLKCLNSYFFDKEGENISPEEFGKKFEDRSYQIVKQEYVNGYFISTVWLGIDFRYSYEEKPKPVIFETMVFDKEGDPVDKNRSCTQEEALQCHKDMKMEYGKIENG